MPSLLERRQTLIHTSGKVATVQTFSTSFKKFDATGSYRLGFRQFHRLITAESSAHTYTKISYRNLCGVIKQLHHSIQLLAVGFATCSHHFGSRKQ